VSDWLRGPYWLSSTGDKCQPYHLHHELLEGEEHSEQHLPGVFVLGTLQGKKGKRKSSRK
jgi:hypothetical protein